MSVEIVGRACLTPGADGPEELFQLLKDRRCAVTQIPRDRWDQARYWHPGIGVPGKTYTFAAGIIDDIYGFDPALFGMSRPEATSLDPQQRLALKLTWRALEDANIDPARLRGENVGVYIGASALDHANLIVEDPAAAGPYFMSGNTLSVIANRISHVFGLAGPSMAIDTACSSSLVALVQAVQAIRAGAIDTAIVGGVNVLTHPLPFIGFAQARMLSPEGLCRAYDDAGAGYVRAEGGAVLVLRRSDKARAERDRSHATILASASNSAGRTNGISLPSPQAQAALLASIYGDGGIDAARLAFVEGHGTGTRVGDPSELRSLGTAIGLRRRAPIAVGSIKTNIGHTEPASGVLGLMKAMLALEHDFLPASLHFETPHRDVDLEALNIHVASDGLKLLPDRRGRLAGVNSFGFGGTNAHVVISDPPRCDDAASGGHARSFLVSAQSRAALEAVLADYREQMAGAPEAAGRLVGTAGANRALLEHRFVVPSTSPTQVRAAIQSFLDERKSGDFHVGQARGGESKLAFVFSGNGSQWAGMGVDAYRNDDQFRRRFDEIAALFRIHIEANLADLLQSPDLAGKLRDTRIAQPLLFALQAALADSLCGRGLRPSALLGHSVGEITAAYAAGALSLADAVQVIAKRSAHQHSTAGLGKMAAVMMTADAVLDLATRHRLQNLHIAAHNAREAVTVTGPGEEVDAFAEIARWGRRPVTMLDIDYPFHHPLVDSHKAAFLTDLPGLYPRSTHTTFISGVTGAVMSGTELCAGHWWRNLREPVLFAKAAATALEQDCTLLLEIGPRPILTSYLNDAIRQAGRGMALPSLSKGPVGASVNPVQATFATVLANGGSIEREAVFGMRDATVRHPALPFDETSLEPVRTSDGIDLYGRKLGGGSLAGWRVDPAGSTWKNHVDARLLADLAEHVVDGKAIMPGTGFLEMAVSAAREYFRQDQVEIVHFDMIRPLELKADTISEVSTAISPETGLIEIRSRPRLSDAEWMVHARGRCRPLRADAVVAEDLSRPANAVTLDAAGLYETARRFGLHYGPKFQLVKHVSADERAIEVTLAAPAAPANPYIRYAVDPISADAALHGLMGMFERIAEGSAETPYIPIHVGSFIVLRPGAVVSQARIRVHSAGRHSIRASLALLDSDGGKVAAIGNLRLKRAALRQRPTLDAASYHYEAVPVADAPRESGPVMRRTIVGWAEAVSEAEPSGATLLLGAAAYRAAFDIAGTFADSGRIDAVRIEEGGDIGEYRALCLQWLAEAGLARAGERGWVLAESRDIPEFADLLNVIHREAAERVVEAVAIADARHWAMRPNGSERPRRVMSSATLDHLTVHSTLARDRLAILEDGLSAAARAMPHNPTVVEFGGVSASFSRRMIDLTVAKGGHYIVVEDREPEREALARGLASIGNVDVVASADFPADASADLVLSACNEVHGLIGEQPEAEALLGRLLGSGAAFLAAFEAGGVTSDLIHGQRPGWLSEGREGAIGGKLANEADWLRLLEALGAEEPAVRRISRSAGELVLVGVEGDAGSPVQAEPTVSGKQGFLWVSQGECGAAGDADALAQIERAVEHASEDAALVYDAGPVAAGDRPAHLEDAVARLSHLARCMAAISEEGRIAPPLLVLLDGGAPTASIADPAHAGIWTFLRALRNEYPDLEIHAVDTTGSDRKAQGFEALLARCLHAGDGGEWLIADGRLWGLRAVPGPRPAAEEGSSDFAAATVHQGAGSSLAHIGWSACDLPKPGDDEVLIEVAATGLNFRDVMWAMRLLPEEALEDGFAGATIGMECSGTVLAVGADVSRFAVGDRVMAFAPAAFSTHVAVTEKAVVRLPDGIELPAAATIPVAFLTAHYALNELGRLKPGETVLIHGGAGGVGLAALQIARLRQARVIATAGTAEKRGLLRLLGADHVLDSRSLSFVREARKLTNGEGVDVVLNSLSGEAMERSISLLRPFGRFLELGKRDFYADSKIGLRPFRRNISYFGIDADQLLQAEPALAQRLLDELSQQFAERQLVPLPYRCFRHDEIRSAFRLMQGSGHIGKLVVTPPRAGSDAVASQRDARLSFDPDGFHLVVGGIGGFGLAAADWLVERGARRIALCSRGGRPDEATMERIARWAESGVEAVTIACDVTDAAQVEMMLEGLRGRAPLKSILHAAMVLDDGLLPNLSRERNKPVIATKARGAEHLDRLTRQDDLDHFILFSSVTTLIGNIGQANYVAANGYLEGLARRRRAEGLPALAVGFGPISDAGVLASRADLNDRLARRMGDQAGMEAREALRLVEAYITGARKGGDAGCVVIADIDWAAASKLRTVRSPIFAPILRARRGALETTGLVAADLGALLADKTDAEGEALIYGIVSDEMAAALQMPVSGIARDMVLKDIGLDSLMAVELGMSLEKRTGLEIQLNGLSETATIGTLVGKLLVKARNAVPAEQRSAAAQVSGLAKRHTAAA